MKIKKNVWSASLSTFKIGGKARYFCETENDEDLLEAVKLAKKNKLPWRILGGGSNVVFPDGILKCFLIKLTGGKIRILGNKIIADAGVELDKVIRLAIKNNLAGLEKLAGIPGTVGGAIVGNAGAYGYSISKAIEKVEIFSAEGGSASGGDSVKNKRWLLNKNCNFGYRDSIFKKKSYIILQAVFKLKKSDKKKLWKIYNDIIVDRRKKYPSGIFCAGSFFKNVLVKDISLKSLKLVEKEKIINGKIPAGYLLEMVGAKGMRCGGIQIADFHGNLFINRGNAKASEVKRVARILKNRVKRKFGITLEEEIRYF